MEYIQLLILLRYWLIIKRRFQHVQFWLMGFLRIIILIRLIRLAFIRLNSFTLVIILLFIQLVIIRLHIKLNLVIT